ncbi:carbon-nitrogen hydrolase family protein [Hoeflea prorocentri]|uniref:Carbon-nitrogen hydrolase family protein n=1 Tax=Hoeflea prorocentri TaxID=1922333 RepID=A0A9X3UMZ3_9HYPH|nr:carbon-nitrogen hydrolase family protein [Hoeflea prorocentri]MCY6383678.1 carbon-nitrogen hydrolase family protein [Hoeflea prorocentri]MDA5401478.1 carbon-nitrogen hydrolase family protein [Hoeflea prorocentri]
MSGQTFRAAAIQMRSGMDPQSNIRDLRDGVKEAAGRGADYVQTPEMTGALVRDRAGLCAILKDEADDPVVAAASDLAHEYGIHLHIGSTAVAAAGGKAANRAYLFDPSGSLVAHYDKIHMFDVDLDNGESWRESTTYEPGNRAVLAQLPFADLGFGICYDVRFPELFQTLALSGADLLTVPAAFTRQTGQAHWHTLLRARAIENGAFIVAAAQGGQHEDGRETFGHSLMVDPWGRIIAEADHDEPAVITAEIDRSLSRSARGKVPNLKNRRDFGLTLSGAAVKAEVSV